MVRRFQTPTLEAEVWKTIVMMGEGGDGGWIGRLLAMAQDIWRRGLIRMGGGVCDQVRYEA